MLIPTVLERVMCPTEMEALPTAVRYTVYVPAVVISKVRLASALSSGEYSFRKWILGEFDHFYLALVLYM